MNLQVFIAPTKSYRSNCTLILAPDMVPEMKRTDNVEGGEYSNLKVSSLEFGVWTDNHEVGSRHVDGGFCTLSPLNYVINGVMRAKHELGQIEIFFG